VKNSTVVDQNVRVDALQEQYKEWLKQKIFLVRSQRVRQQILIALLLQRHARGHLTSSSPAWINAASYHSNCMHRASRLRKPSERRHSNDFSGCRSTSPSRCRRGNGISIIFTLLDWSQLEVPRPATISDRVVLWRRRQGCLEWCSLGRHSHRVRELHSFYFCSFIEEIVRWWYVSKPKKYHIYYVILSNISKMSHCLTQRPPELFQDVSLYGTCFPHPNPLRHLAPPSPLLPTPPLPSNASPRVDRSGHACVTSRV